MKSRNTLPDKELQKIKSCPTRELCPLSDICAKSHGDSNRLIYPKTLSVKRGDLLWTTHYAEDRVLVFKKGVFLSIGYSNQEREVPFCLYGPGNSVGLSDMFTAEDIRSSYHVRTLLEGEVCSFSADVLRRELGEYSDDYVHATVVSTLMSQCAGAFTLAMIKNQKSMTDRIVALLHCLRDFANRIDINQAEFNITHEDIALVVGADRTTTTRALNKIVADKVIERKYGKIKLLTERAEDPSSKQEYHTNFIQPKTNEAEERDSKYRQVLPGLGAAFEMV